MSELWHWLFGIKSSSDMLSESSWALRCQALPEGLGAVALGLSVLLVLVGIWFLYRVESRGLSLPKRLLLVSLRLAALGCVTAMLLEVVLVITKKESVPSQLLVLVDDSQSMELKDPYADQESADRTTAAFSDGNLNLSADKLRSESRSELGRRALQGLLKPLSEDRQLVLYRFASELEPLDQTKLESLKAKGSTSAIGDALTAALAAHRGQPLAGVLIASDGQSNSGEDARKAAQRAARDGVMIHTLALGTEQGPSNARLVEIESSPIIFVRDPTEVSVLYESRGMTGSTGSVTLEVRHDGGPWSDVGREEVVLGADSVLGRSTFKFTPEAIGQYEFRGTMGGTGSELTENDNMAVKSIKVVRQRVRALLISGYPSPEMQFLRNTLLRDTALEFASWLQSAGEGYEQVGHRPLRRLPDSLEELSHYDVIILFDPDFRALKPEWPAMLHKFVSEAGGGLVYIAGELHSHKLLAPTNDADNSIDNSWLRVLPVVSEPGLYQSSADVQLSSREIWTLELTPEGETDSIFRFDEQPARNREIMASLPGMYWHLPVTRAKPGATVLARHGDPRMHNSYGRHVLLATQRYGPGYTVFIGFDSTFRWRYLHEEYFDGFWTRLVDRVGRNKALGGRYPFILSLDKAAYRPGDRVVLRAEWIENGPQAGNPSQLRGEVEVPGAQPISLELEQTAEKQDTLETSFTVEEPGPYLIRIVPATTDGEETTLRPATLDFKVNALSQELDRPAIDRALLEDMARATGGQYFTLADYRKISEHFKIKQVERVLEYRDEVWDAPLLFGALVVLLTAEWITRKWNRLA